MCFSYFRSSLRPILALCLLGQLAPVAAENASGVMIVSMTVVASCEVRADSAPSFDVVGEPGRRPAEFATVVCPFAHPYRTSLSHESAVGVMPSVGDAQHVFNGVRQMDLSGRPGGETLTISY